ncbi:MAG TPA: DUF3579 domain-containing protein [Gammaproteobacteria bacterium]|nr:DUF3579 domain-containing protein [Gammaproteobacteria bacterium]
MTSNRNKSKTMIIRGITKDGRKFRPSDWAERMSGMLSHFGEDHRVYYSPKLRPISIEGIKCIAIDTSLKQSHPEIFKQIMNFAKRNELNIVDEASV